MTNESLLDKDWDATVVRFGGAEHLEKEARELGVFRRIRAIKCARDLLRLTAAWAEAVSWSGSSR